MDSLKFAAGTAVYVKAAPAKIINYVESKGLASIDTDIVAEGAIFR